MNIFISYNRQSQSVTTTLANDIEEMGHEVWYDQELSGGQSWWDQILSQIRGCDVFVFVLESAALNSIACKREYSYADALRKPILPVLVSEGISTNILPPALSKIQFVDYRNQDRRSALLLARAFTSIKIASQLPDPLPPSPEAPISYLGGLTELVESNDTLNLEQQSTLVINLRRSLRDSETTADSQTLLKKLRKRRDLYATIAEEIDELIGIARQFSSSPSISTDQSNTKVESSQLSGMNALLNTNQAIVPRKRGKGAIIGAIVGLVMGGIQSLNAHFSSDGGFIFLIMFIVGVAGAITGVISGATNKRIIFNALIKFVFSFFILWILLYADGIYHDYYYSYLANGMSSNRYKEKYLLFVTFCAILSSMNVKLIDYLIKKIIALRSVILNKRKES